LINTFGIGREEVRGKNQESRLFATLGGLLHTIFELGIGKQRVSLVLD
jgi:hypothetical protein